ncbi:sensor histidine kinase [uncultured Aquimarina sp.]|uniref:sensor histidine kinase n=1 Tax=uncultured Aquimarina sp. TaxID=575652 RepID=UPI00261A8B96|nr:histidine kinase [uncultured Aquimarina sp.]
MTFIIIITFFSIVAFHLILWIHHLVLFKVIEPEREGIRYVWVVMGITSVLIGWLIVFQQKQRINELEREQLIKENIQNELLALKSQINPHFLFNSLNSLNYIIRNFPEEATDYVDRLSLIFRYILQSRDKNLIPLKDEIDFLNNYMHLGAIRYGTNVKIAMNITKEYHFILIPILSLQILLENAIKHNEVSKEYPLTIKIYIENEYLIIENKIQPRNNPEESTGYGLTNLSKRYILLKEKDIEVYKNDHFIVKLPLS